MTRVGAEGRRSEEALQVGEDRVFPGADHGCGGKALADFLCVVGSGEDGERVGREELSDDL